MKNQKAIRLGTAALAKALCQADDAARAKPACVEPVVLWMNGSNGWALTFRTEWGATTVTGDDSIGVVLECLIRTEDEA